MSSSTPFPFRIPERRGSTPSDPENLFRSLSQRSPHIQHLWSHQADVLRSWHSSHIDTPDLALELPTGTGKTLIGLLIGDFVRQTRQERVAYLCPNRQLAHQVGRLADDYSIDARVLVGSQATYDPNDFSAFEDSSAVAVTTYSAVFNTNPMNGIFISRFSISSRLLYRVPNCGILRMNLACTRVPNVAKYHLPLLTVVWLNSEIF